MPATIRPYAPRDAQLLATLYLRSVRELGSRDYSAAQVAAWASLCPSPEQLHALSDDGRTRLVAVDEADLPVAFADLERDGHIHFFYAAPEVAGTGVAQRLYAELEQVARAQHLTRLHAEASERAHRFFLRLGFQVTAKREFTVTGVPIHNYAVEKQLDEAGAAPAGSSP
ncbi:GNAT family N-acetyltransferase [Geminicoccus harenae]|uniref:GNAT family N-acetyltransferase n=1 Tax=Geminicoccus harenae TaxID=2498453 RepID=UPI00168B81C4|nr:GNAT family N-acetyltransferase [Geminicoccus harenae]